MINDSKIQMVAMYNNVYILEKESHPNVELSPMLDETTSEKQ